MFYIEKYTRTTNFVANILEIKAISHCNSSACRLGIPVMVKQLNNRLGSLLIRRFFLNYVSEKDLS